MFNFNKTILSFMYSNMVPVKSIWPALIGGALGLIGVNQQVQASKGAANAAAKAAEFHPYDVSAQGLGGATFDEEGRVASTSLDPRLAGMAGGQYGTAERYFGATPQAYQTDPRLFGLGSGALGAGQQFLQGAQQQQPSGLGQVGQGIGMLGQGAGLVGQQLGAAAPYFGQAGGMDVGGAGRGFLDQLNQYDPQAATQARYGQLEELLAPGRERTRSDLESKLLRQGRLGSTGGSLQQEGLESSIGQQQLQNLLGASGEARAQQQQLLGLGTGLGQQEAGRAQALTGLGLQQGGLFGQAAGQMGSLGGQFLGAGMGIENLGMARQGQQAGLFGQMLGAGGSIEGLRGAEDFKQLQLEQAYQQAGQGALQSGMNIYQSPQSLLSMGAQLGGRQAQAGAIGAGFMNQAAMNQADAQSAIYGGLGRAIGGMNFGGGNPYTAGQYGTTPGSQQTQMLAEQDRGLF